MKNYKMNLPKDIIQRNSYIDSIRPFMYQPIIKVLTGQRRVGKSFMLYEIMNVIQKERPDVKIIYINHEDLHFDFIKDYKDLNNYLIENMATGESHAIFIDEIQDIEAFEKALRSLLLRENTDIYVTGSNSKMLSSDISTYLSGRYVEIPIYSLSYQEFLEFNNLQDDDKSLALFMKYGGLPYLKNLKLDDEIVYEYLKSIYSTILYRDIVKRYNIRNTEFLERLVLFIADNIGSLFSAKNISDFLKSQNIRQQSNQILTYMDYLSQAFIIHKVRKYDIVGKRIFEIGEKFYFNDLGIRNSIIGYKPQDRGKLVENLVYNHLLFCGYDVKVGYSKGLEIDFVSEKQNEKIYVQVALQLGDGATVEREFGNLLKIKDNYPKYVVTLDPFFGNSYNGIEHFYLRDFLKKKL